MKTTEHIEKEKSLKLTPKHVDLASLINQINDIRDQLQENRQQYTLAESAPVPFDEAFQVYETKINELAAVGQKHLEHLAGECCVAPHHFTFDLFPEVRDGSLYGYGSSGVFAFIVKDQLLDNGREMVKKYQEIHGDFVIPQQDRVGVLTQLDNEFFALECQEESLIDQVESAGVVYTRRPNVTPEAVFGVSRGAALPLGWYCEKFETLLRLAEGGRGEIDFLRESALEARANFDELERQIKGYRKANEEVPKKILAQLTAAGKKRELTAQKMADAQKIVQEKVVLAASLEDYVKNNLCR